MGGLNLFGGLLMVLITSRTQYLCVGLRATSLLVNCNVRIKPDLHLERPGLGKDHQGCVYDELGKR